MQEDVKYKIYSSFYDQNLTHTLVEAAHNPLTTVQMVQFIEIFTVISVSAERLFFEYLKATFNDDVNLIKILVQELIGSCSETRRAVTTLLRQLVSDTTQKKDFAEFFLSTVLHSVADAISKGAVQAFGPLL